MACRDETAGARTPSPAWIAIAAGVGVALGAGVGAALGHIALGAGIGTALGTAAGNAFVLTRARRP